MNENIISKLLFKSVKPLIRISKSRPIEHEDFPTLENGIDPKPFLDHKPPIDLSSPASLLWSVFSIKGNSQAGTPNVRKRLVWTVLLMLTRVGVSLIPPFLLHYVMLFFESLSSGVPLQWGIFLILSLTLATLVEAAVISHYFFNSQKLGLVVTNVLSLAIYRQNLNLTQEDRRHVESGELLNYMGPDVESSGNVIIEVIEFTHDMLVIVFVSMMLFFHLGYAALAPMALMLLLAPVNKITSNKFAKIDSKRRKIRDKRVTLVGQAVNTMRLVKHYVWEKRIEQEVNTVRQQELEVLKSHVEASVTAFSIYGAIRILTALTGFGMFLWLGNPLTAAIIFPSLALFRMLEAPFGDATEYIAELMGAKVALQRIIGFLKIDPHGLHNTTGNNECAKQIEVKALSVRFEADADEVLSTVNFSVFQGEKVALVGAVGSGKTVLLETLLGEIPFRGKVSISSTMGLKKARIAFVSQSPAAMNGTVRENIVFGREGQVDGTLIDHTCLSQDLSEWPGGLETEIGENGVNLSGGQKQRLSLARAAFQKEDLVLLDDPFSALDPHVEKDIAQNLLQNHWKDSTVILSTHRFHCLEMMDRIVFLKDGKVAARGTLKELLDSNLEFQRFYQEHEKTKKLELEKTQESVDEETEENEEETEEDSDPANITTKESRQLGRIKTRLYLDYFNKLCALPNPLQRIGLLIVMVVAILMAAIAPILQDLWLVALSEEKSSEVIHWVSSFGKSMDMESNLWIYAGVGGFALFWLAFSHWIWRKRALVAGKKIHEQAWNRIMHTPIRFFDQNPSGRIINRFSRDLEEVDSQLGENYKKFIFAVAGALTNIIFMVTVIPLLIVLLPILVIFSFSLQLKYLRLTRDFKRLGAISRSPVLAFFKESVVGHRQIRAFHQEETFLHQFCEKIYQRNQIDFQTFKIRWWYLLNNSMINSAFIGTLALSAFALVQQGYLSTSIAGLALTYSLMFSYAIPQIVESMGEVQSQMTSWERLDDYRMLPPEEAQSSTIQLKPNWPSLGHVEFKGVHLRYDAHLPLVLKGLSFQAEPQKTLGIVGRTGSGKSTIFQALFRFMTVEEGQILVDGVDIATIPLEQLRQQIAIVPQDPILFSGTVLSNLAPEGKSSEAQVTQMMKEAQMFQFVESLKDGLMTKVEEHGKNLSQGQRQLICLARAILLDAKILVMDEATSSLDLETEKLLHQALEKVYRHKTVLLIAHRPESVQFCDHILTLSEGKSI